MKKIPLTQGKFALVDDMDFLELVQYKWCFNKGYAVRGRPKRDGGGMILMHRAILNTPEGMDSDHRDANKLNNQRYNLRICTNGQNQQNQDKYKNNKSGYKGVNWDRSRWRARIGVGGKKIELGRFFCLIKAVECYNEAAKTYHGEFARLN